MRFLAIAAVFLLAPLSLSQREQVHRGWSDEVDEGGHAHSAPKRQVFVAIAKIQWDGHKPGQRHGEEGGQHGSAFLYRNPNTFYALEVREVIALEI